MLKLWQLLPFYLVLSSVYAIPCKIRVPEDVTKQTPVILKDNELFKSNIKETKIEDGKSITLFCAGPDNKVKDPDNKDKYLNQAVTLTCNNGKFRHKGKEYRLRDMECKTVPSSELIETRTSCANGAGKFYKVGFTYNNKFLEVLTICFNKATQRTIYSRNIIKRSVENGSFLPRGNLAPNGDYTFCNEQFATYFANCAPEWQVVNAGNWANVEKATHQLAINTDLLTFTSTFGVLELPMPHTSRLTTNNLDQTKKLVAPKWYYKVVMNPNWNMDIVFVTLNNPHDTVGKEVEFCKNICGNIHGLDPATFRDASRGYTFCCELKDFWRSSRISTSVNPYFDLPTGWSSIPCKIRVPEDVPEQTPVILKDNELFKPNNKETKIENGESITLFCAGQDNKLKDPHNEDKYLNQAVTLTCKNGKFQHGKTEYNLKEMKCNTVPNSELRETSKACGDVDSKFYEVGFTYQNTFLEILTICFQKATQRTIYSRNIIKRNVENVRMSRVCNTPPFRKNGMSFQPNEFYKVDNQKERFTNLFGSDHSYLKQNKALFLARGHLAPNADFTFCYEQFATFYFANCAPEWQVVNAGNWADVEKATRQLAINTDILTFTGTFDVLKLQKPNTHIFTEIYLDQTRKLVAPTWYYKVVHNPNWDNDIVFVTLNNPHDTVGKEVEFCKNICEEYGLDSSFYGDFKRGYTFCCELKDFWTKAGINNSVDPYYDLPTEKISNECKIRVPEDVTKQTPVILKDNELFKPNIKETKIKDGKSITLFCAGQDNKVKDPDNKRKYLIQAVTLTCNNGKFRHKGKEYTLRDMECKMVPSSELIETDTTCANGAGVLNKVGFKYQNTFLEILTICFHKATQRTIYSRNIMKRSVENGSFLPRGNLSPSGVYTFCNDQFATYFANCAHEGQVPGNWANVEKATRQLAINTDLLTFTSTFGVLELPMPHTSRLTTKKLDQTRKLVAPKWYYKVLMNPNWNIDIVFVTLNNPHDTVGKEVEFCNNICRKYGLHSPTFKDYKLGYTFCCELKDFWATARISTSVSTYYNLETGWSYK